MCEGTGERQVSLHLPGPVFQRLQSWVGEQLPHEGVLATPCENCEASGEVEETRPLTLNELSPLQFAFLLEADLYRENGDQDEQPSGNPHGGMPGQGGGHPSPGGMPGGAAGAPHGGGMPSRRP